MEIADRIPIIAARCYAEWRGGVFPSRFPDHLPSHHSCPSDWMSVSAAAVALQLGSSRRARAVAVWFSLDQHGPDDTRGLGRERHHHDLVGSAREQIPQPRIADPARHLMPRIGAAPLYRHG